MWGCTALIWVRQHKLLVQGILVASASSAWAPGVPHLLRHLDPGAFPMCRAGVMAV